jgi:hypothetical protein
VRERGKGGCVTIEREICIPRDGVMMGGREQSHSTLESHACHMPDIASFADDKASFRDTVGTVLHEP